MTKLRVLDLFSGIGGFSLGLARTGGFETVAFCEVEPFARRVLAKHWAGVRCYDDVHTLTAERLRADGLLRPDVICGGFPCQDISLSGSGAGLGGARSGLWFEFLRLIGEARPRWAIIENVAALRNRGLDDVLRGLATIGYDAEWHCIPASAVGAPHRRDRIWIVAYPNGGGRDGRAGNVAEPHGRDEPSNGCQYVVDADKPRLEILIHGQAGEQPTTQRTHAWSVEPDVGRVAYGVPSRVDRITRLGNAVIPQIPELIGRAILAAAQEAA